MHLKPNSDDDIPDSGTNNKLYSSERNDDRHGVYCQSIL